MRIQEPWNDWLAEPLSHDHLVHHYAEEISLVEALSIYAGVGLGKGEAVVLVMARDHALAMRERLYADGFETSDLERWGQLRILDAADLLGEFMVDGLPDAARFGEVCDSLMATARGASRAGRVRVYGEMVNLLWRQRNEDAALALERLWNDAIRKHRMPLLCAYRTDAGRVLPDDLTRAHTHVVPAGACE